MLALASAVKFANVLPSISESPAPSLISDKLIEKEELVALSACNCGSNDPSVNRPYSAVRRGASGVVPGCAARKGSRNLVGRRLGMCVQAPGVLGSPGPTLQTYYLACFFVAAVAAE